VTKKTKTKASGVAAAIMDGVRRAGFKAFRAYVASRARLSLREMAVELGVVEGAFLTFHAQWVRDNAPPPAVEV
jgi:hypothetical protein